MTSANIREVVTREVQCKRGPICPQGYILATKWQKRETSYMRGWTWPFNMEREPTIDGGYRERDKDIEKKKERLRRGCTYFPTMSEWRREMGKIYVGFFMNEIF